MGNMRVACLILMITLTMLPLSTATAEPTDPKEVIECVRPDFFAGVVPGSPGQPITQWIGVAYDAGPNGPGSGVQFYVAATLDPGLSRAASGYFSYGMCGGVDGCIQDIVKCIEDIVGGFNDPLPLSDASDIVREDPRHYSVSSTDAEDDVTVIEGENVSNDVLELTALLVLVDALAELTDSPLE